MMIRPATAADVPAVLPMVRKISALHEQWDRERFGLRGDPATSYESWMIHRCTDPQSVFLVAEDDSSIVGYLVGTVEDEIPIYWMPRCGWIHDVWVEQAFRHSGLGRRLTEMAVERFKAMGIRQIRLQAAFANKVGQELFESCGFRVCTIEMLRQLS